MELKSAFVPVETTGRIAAMGQNRLPCRPLAVIIATVAIGWVLYATPEAAWARAGGGEGYSGGGDGGGGGGGGGGGHGNGGGALIYLLFQLVFRYPVIGIPVLIIVIAYFIFSNRGQQSG